MKTLKDYEQEFWSKFNIAYVNDKGFAGLGLEINDFYRHAFADLMEEMVGEDKLKGQIEGYLEDKGYDLEVGYNEAKAEIRERIKKMLE